MKNIRVRFSDSRMCHVRIIRFARGPAEPLETALYNARTHVCTYLWCFIYLRRIWSGKKSRFEFAIRIGRGRNRVGLNQNLYVAQDGFVFVDMVMILMIRFGFF